MELGDVFRDAARSIVHKFSIADYTISKVSGEVYDPVTGSFTRSLVSVTVPMVKTNLHDSLAYFPRASEGHVLIASGLDLGDFVPDVGDTVIDPEGGEVTIIDKKSDQYGAQYSLLVK